MGDFLLLSRGPTSAGRLRHFLLTAVMVCLVQSDNTPEEEHEICLTETFRARCPDNQVIVMETAKYGRMRIGRCVQTDFGFVGCFVDTLDLADARCSGRRRCTIPVPDPQFETRVGLKQCNKEFKAYLEVKYTCMPVTSPPGRSCSTAGPMKLSAPSGSLASVITDETSCGSVNNPWFIEARPGQRVNLTLLDFSSWPAEGPSSLPSQRCSMYATLRETVGGYKEDICGYRGQRERHVYTSVTSSLEVRITRPRQGQSRPYFIITYQVIGCADPELSPGAWLERDGNVAKVGCSDQDVTWRLECRGTAWHGEFANCSIAAASRGIPGPGAKTRLLSLPFDLAVIIIAGVAIVIGGLIFLTGIYVIRRRTPRARRPQPSTVLLTQTPPQKYVQEDYDMSGRLTRSSLASGGPLKPHEILISNENEYAYVLDQPLESVPPPPPPPAGGSTFLGERLNRSDPALTRHLYDPDNAGGSGGQTHAHGGYERRLPMTPSEELYEGQLAPTSQFHRRTYMEGAGDGGGPDTPDHGGCH